MIQALYNIAHWPIFLRKKGKEEVVPEDKIEVDPKVGFGLFAKEDRKSCAILDTADRAAALFGKPALEVYLEIVKIHELWSHSESDTVAAIYEAGYVNPAKAMWAALIEQWTGFAVVPPPLGGAYATPELIFPELFKISEASRNLIVTQVPWAIYTYDWQEFLAKRATYWYPGLTSCGDAYQAWRELEAARGRSQPDIANPLNYWDNQFGWQSPKLWFVGPLGMATTSGIFSSLPRILQTMGSPQVIVLFVIRIKAGLPMRYDGPDNILKTTFWSAQVFLRDRFGIDVFSYGVPR